MDSDELIDLVFVLIAVVVGCAGADSLLMPQRQESMKVWN